MKINTFTDCRGHLKFIDMSKNIKEQFISVNKKNVLRGIHCSPYGKIITCLKGSIVDYNINLKDLSFEKNILNENESVYIPPNHGHLFISLIDDSWVLYQLEGKYDSEKDINIHYTDPFINLDIPSLNEYIISDKDKLNPFYKKIDYIILGASGFLGSYTCSVMDKLNKNYLKLNTRLESEELYNQLLRFKPTYVICAAGISGKPTVKWCETNKEETLYVNYTLQLKLAKICKDLGIHLTIYGSGLIYKNKGIYNESVVPNLEDFYYSKVRIMLEKDLDYKNVLYLRILYPISGDNHEKCFINKIKTRLNTVHDIKINCTVLQDLIPGMFNLIENNKTGIYNFTNPGLISIPEIINIIDDKLKFNIEKTIDEYPELNISKLKLELPSIKDIKSCIYDLKKNKVHNKMQQKKIWYAPNKLDAYGDVEINSVTSCLKDGWLAGFGPKTQEFEEKISSYFGKKYGLFVNSGSSANLLAISSIKTFLNLSEYDEVITPACTFATTVAPILQCKLKPVFCDVGINDYVADIDEVISLITEKTKIIILPNLIGNKPDWKKLREYLSKINKKIYLIEDSCDTITTTEFTDISTTSFYASHLITAGGSGGMVMFNDSELLRIATMYRDWGRIGDNKESVEDRFNYEIDGISYDWKFLYDVIGYNFKSSEMNAAFGLVQFSKIDDIKFKRRQLFERYLLNLKDNNNIVLPNDDLKTDWLAIPLICNSNRKVLLTYLENNNVQTRVCFSGNITKHPAYQEFKKDFKNSDNIMAKGFLLGCHHGMTLDDVDYVCNLLNIF